MGTMRGVHGAAMVVVLALASQAAYGQGILMVEEMADHARIRLPRLIVRPTPQPPVSYKIKQLAVDARIVDQVARVRVSQTFVNTGSRQMDVAFVFPLPYDGAIDQLTLLVDGKEYPAKLLTAEKARKIYEGYMRRNRDPALLEWIGTGMFRTSVFPVPAGAQRKITLRYNQLLRKDGALTDFLFPLGTAKYTSAPVEEVRFRIAIESSIEIKNIYSPTHPVNISRPDDQHAVVEFIRKNETPTTDFRLFYGVADGKLGANVISYRPEGDEDGYLLLLASPEIKAPSVDRPRKRVVCVLDRSGSMNGKKIKQAKQALEFVINNLREGDLFNIVAYDSEVESFRPELQTYSEKTRKQALGFVAGVYAGGGTNIAGALKTSLTMLKESKRPSYLIFLTDGLPTVGESNEGKIVAMVKRLNGARTRLMNFGVGYDVNSRLLDRLSRVGRGQSLFVRPDENIESHVSRLYDKIKVPVLTDVQVRFEFDALRSEEGDPINRMVPKQPDDLFQGAQLVAVGRYRKSGHVKVRISGAVGDNHQQWAFPADLVKSSVDNTYAFVEKLWAMRRIGEIIDQLDLEGKNDELIQELIALSTQHGILTPYTSFLADDQTDPEILAQARVGGRLAMENAVPALKSLDAAGGRSGFAQRELKSHFRRAEITADLESAVVDAMPAGQYGGGVIAGARLRQIDQDRDKVVNSVRNIGNCTLYQRGRLWVAANALDVDSENDRDQITVVQRFSPDYFALVKANLAWANDVLSRQRDNEEILIRLQGKIYHIK